MANRTIRTWGCSTAAMLGVLLPLLAEAVAPPRVTRLAAVAVGAPTGTAIDAAGNLYVVESTQDRLTVFSPDGTVRHSLDGLATPVAVAVAADGGVYVANTGRRSVERYSPQLVRELALGRGDGEFGKPVALAVAPGGAVYVADAQQDAVKVYGPDGAARFTIGAGDTVRLQFPTALAIDPTAGELYVTDRPDQSAAGGRYGAARVQVFDLEGAPLRSFGSYGVEEGQLTRPLGIAVDQEHRVYISDAFQNVVLVYDDRGGYLGSLYDPDHPLRTPLGAAYCRTSNRLLVASLNTGTVEVFGIDNYCIPPLQTTQEPTAAVQVPESPPLPLPESVEGAPDDTHSPTPEPPSEPIQEQAAAGQLPEAQPAAAGDEGGGAQCFLQTLCGDGAGEGLRLRAERRRAAGRGAP